MKDQIKKTERFLQKHKFPLNKSLKDYKENVVVSSYLREVALELIESAAFIESRLHNQSDPRFLRVHVMIEEIGETILGLANCDETETLDGLSDLLFTTIGTGLTFDLPSVEGLDEACDSNLTKRPRERDDPRLRDKGSDYRSPNMKRVLSLHRGIRVEALRTPCISDKPTYQTVIHIKRRYLNELKSWWIYVAKGGVTGYESMEEKDVDTMCGGWGWCVCAGAKNKYDKLSIPAEEMQKISEWLKQK